MLDSAFDKMLQEGLEVPYPKEALQMLRRLDETSESSRHTLSEFLEIIGADEKFFHIALQVVYSDFPADINIFSLDDAHTVLSELKENHDLALVTVGKEERQLVKMKKAGIDSTIFSKIIVSEDRDKKPHFQSTIAELGYEPADTFACGDKVTVDLAPAKELGFKTIHMRWGRGKNAPFIQGAVDYTITELKQIKEILLAYDYK